MKKIGRNDSCSCGSGQKYKYCCIGFKSKIREVHTPSDIINPEGMEAFKLIMNSLSSQDEGLRNFCKDNGFYYFKNISIADSCEVHKKLSSGILTKEDLFICYRKHTTHEYVHRMLQTAIKQSDTFKKRQVLLESAVESHFKEQYELSIPSFFILIEGILRGIGELKLKDKFKPTMKGDGLEEKVLYSNADSIRYFNAFISNLYKGSQEEKTFNRNTVLHGANNSCFNKDNSILLLLTILEIQNYIFHDKSWPPKLKIDNGIRTLYHPNT